MRKSQDRVAGTYELEGEGHKALGAGEGQKLETEKGRSGEPFPLEAFPHFPHGDVTLLAFDISSLSSICPQGMSFVADT